MKSLIFTTGKEGLLKKTLDDLFNEGEYRGDILVLEYDQIGDSYTDKFKNYLKEHNGIIVKVKRVWKYYSIDRIRATYNILKENEMYKNYDVIMYMDGHDIRIFKPIQELLDTAFKYNKICCVPEDNGISRSVNIEWDGYLNYPVEKTSWWEHIKYKVMINAGLFVGPSKLIMELLEYMVKGITGIETWGIDQVLFNAYCYEHKENVMYMGIEWNYLGWFGRYSIEYDGCKAYLPIGVVDVKILHLVNIMKMRKPWDKMIVRPNFNFEWRKI